MPRVQHILSRSLCCLLLSAAVSWPQPSLAADIELPVLGDSASGIVSKQQEHMIGRSWLKAFRSRINEHQDPLLKQYLEQLLYTWPL